ncbi:hypothetical protein MLD52_21125 [Puniceicoccaceae bacterium K14]|nr:hypothetical protein [Puniceicoccaceae bacterium K14]
MIFTRSIGSLIRGKTTPFQLYSASFLGAAIGLIPEYHLAPGLSVFWLLFLLFLNANLYFAGIVGLLAKAVSIVAMPMSFYLGKILLEGPTEAIFKSLANAPIFAYFGLEYYSVVGGQLIGVIVGFFAAFLASKSIRKYRLKMKSLEGQPTKLNEYKKKGWAKVLTFIFLGSGKGKKTSYDDLLAKRWGNPIRIWGAALCVAFIVVIYLFITRLSNPVVAALIKDNLERANGATVDLESVDLNLKEGRLELNGFAMADPENLETNLFSSNRVVADISAADILRKRFSVDSLVFENSLTGTKRETAGKLVDKSAEKGKDKDPLVELPEYESIDELLDDAKIWKERLGQVKRWLTSMGDKGAETEDKKLSLEETLQSRIEALGYAFVAKDDSIEGAPTVWIRNIVAKQINTHYFEGATVDFIASDLSSHPSLVETDPRIQITASDGSFAADIALGATAGRSENLLNLSIKNLAVDEVASEIKTDGESLLSGGTMNIDVSGNLSSINSDLTLNANLLGSSISIGGSSVPADNIDIPLHFRGPIDNPRIKLDSKAFQKILAKAGKNELLRQASEKYGIDIPEGAEGESIQDTAKNILGSFIKKETEKETDEKQSVEDTAKSVLGDFLKKNLGDKE